MTRATVAFAIFFFVAWGSFLTWGKLFFVFTSHRTLDFEGEDKKNRGNNPVTLVGIITENSVKMFLIASRRERMAYWVPLLSPNIRETFIEY